MNRSTNLNMYLPENSDYRDVSQLTYNFEALDTAAGKIPPEYITFGTSSKTLLENLQDNWTTLVPNDAKPHPVKIVAQYGNTFGYISRVDTDKGTAVLARSDGHMYFFNLNGTVYENAVFTAKRKIKTYTNVTISSNDSPYVKIDDYTGLGVSTNLYCTSMIIRGWSTSSVGCFNIIKGSNGTDFYLLGSKAGSISSVTVEYFFSDTATTL